MGYIYYKDNQVTDEPQSIKLLQVYDNHNLEIDDIIVEFWKNEKSLPSYDFQYLNQRLSEVL